MLEIPRTLKGWSWEKSGMACYNTLQVNLTRPVLRTKLRKLIIQVLVTRRLGLAIVLPYLTIMPQLQSITWILYTASMHCCTSSSTDRSDDSLFVRIGFLGISGNNKRKGPKCRIPRCHRHKPCLHNSRVSKDTCIYDVRLFVSHLYNI
jgi:hypothetical protein